MKTELLDHDNSKEQSVDNFSSLETPQEMDQLNLSGVLIRTVTDLQVMKEKYEGGITVYHKILDTMEMSEDVVVAKQMIKTGLEVHVSLLSFIKSACQLVGVGTEWIEVKEEPNLEAYVKMEIEDDHLTDMIEVKTELSDSKPQGLNLINRNIDPVADEKPFSCDQCGKRYKTKQTMNEHKRLKHKGQTKQPGAPTNVPDGSVLVPKSESNLYKLESTNGEGQDSFCKVSENERDMVPDCQQAVNVMEMSITEKKKFPCSLCHKSYDGKRHLKLHIIGAHTKERPFVCDICNKAFKLEMGLKAHKLQVHSWQRTEDNLYKCAKCDITFQIKMPFISHLKGHCSQCERHFETLEEKKQHIKDAHVEKQFICSTCGYTSPSKKALQQHLKIHEDKEHVCHVCQKAFTHRNDLTEHFRIHTGEKPLVCQLCGMRFRKSSGLSQHKKIHLGERPFECEICGKGFTQRGNLKTHMKSHFSGTIPPIVKPDSP